VTADRASVGNGGGQVDPQSPAASLLRTNCLRPVAITSGRRYLGRSTRISFACACFTLRPLISTPATRMAAAMRLFWLRS
jgi:hypothetical protein